MDDLWQKWNGGSIFILGLLDLSAAFNTIDHGILMGRLWELELCIMLVLLLLTGPVPVGVDRGRES